MDCFSRTPDRSVRVDGFANIPADERREIFNEVAIRLGASTLRSPRKTSGSAGRSGFYLDSVLTIQTSCSRAARRSRRRMRLSNGFQKTSISSRMSTTSCSAVPMTRRISSASRSASGESRASTMHAQSTSPTFCTRRFTTYFGNRLGATGWELSIDPQESHGHTLLFRYPWSDPSREHEYLRGRVKIELRLAIRHDAGRRTRRDTLRSHSLSRPLRISVGPLPRLDGRSNILGEGHGTSCRELPR